MKVLCISITFILATYTGIASSTGHTLTLGIFPYASTAKLIAHQKNIPTLVRDNTGINLSLVTAGDSATFIDRLRAYEYDLIYSPPHLARYAEKKHGYQRVVMTSHQIRGVFLVSKDSPYRSVMDLKNSTISIGPVKTILHQLALRQIMDQGLIPGQDIHINGVNTHNNAIYNLLKHDSDAAITGIKLWKSFPPGEKAGLRELALTDPVSGFIVMARPGLKQTIIDQLQLAFLSFDKSPLGVNYLFKGFKRIDDESMAALDFYTSIFE